MWNLPIRPQQAEDVLNPVVIMPINHMTKHGVKYAVPALLIRQLSEVDYDEIPDGDYQPSRRRLTLHVLTSA